MKLLIDENLPRKIKNLLPEYDTNTVQEMGWSGVKNGELLKLAGEQFDVLITLDQNLQYQQNLSETTIAICVLRARSNRLIDIEPLIPNLKQSLTTIQRGEIIEVTANIKE